eukprot:gb/GECG01013991.1/.p1 GENE.gb/GECG01013991.1/~~gb/GECG01013991.1/.p1  ORF type:complete len:624 (+),score=81.20 gb/GECG01013991.1/:1-1872(+)
MEIALRTPSDSRLVEGPRKTASGEGYEVIPKKHLTGLPPCELFMFSRDGQYLALAEKEQVIVYHVDSAAPQIFVTQRNVTALHFSPLNTYLVTWHRKKGDETNLNVWNVRSGSFVCGFYQRDRNQEMWPTLQWSDDECIACRCVNNEVHFFDGKEMSTSVINRLHLPNVKQASIAPGKGPKYGIGVFVGTSNSRPAAVSFFQYPHLSPAEVIASKSFAKLDEAEFHWTADGKVVLALLSTEMTSDSYYGESRLFLFTMDGKVSMQVPLPKEGPVHDVQWSPKGTEFIAIAGKSPPKAALFDRKGQQLHNFGDASRNTVVWNPFGRFFVLAGFGNMAGEVDFWDRDSLKKLGSNSAPCTVKHIWSPDGRFFMTTTTRPRLQVDNGFKVFRYTGEGPIVHEKHEVLYDVIWRPAPAGTYPDRPASPDALEKATKDVASSSGAAKPRAVYRAPGSTGLVSQMMADARLGSGSETGNSNKSGAAASRTPVGMPNVPPGMPASQAQAPKKGGKNKNKKKNKGAATSAEAPAKEDAHDKDDGEGSVTTPGGSRSEKALEDMTLDELRRERRKLAKKFKQIDNLKKAHADGKELNADERSKVDGEKELSSKLDWIVAQMKALQGPENSKE